jgi:pyridoxine kinase
MGILSIQSQVVSGFVGNSVTGFALQRLKTEIWALPTVLLSHHPGHGGARGGALSAGMKTGILAGLDERGCLSRCDAVISGYLAGPEDADLIKDALRRIRLTKTCFYLCDPVIGDDGKTYVTENTVSAVHNLAAIADIITPNAYELSILAATPLHSTTQAVSAMRMIRQRGPGIVFLTSFAGDDTPNGNIDALILDGAEAWRLRIPRLDHKFSGSGDLVAGLFMHFWLASRDGCAAMVSATQIVFSILRETMRSGADELLLVKAQDFLISPDCRFNAERLN